MTHRGFTLIEVLVTAAVAVMITGFLVTNFSRSRNELAATAPSILGDIRRAQSLAIAGSYHEDSLRCGFGIVFEQDAYTIYAGPPATGSCVFSDQKTSTTGTEVERIALSDTLEFKTLGDIYFVPPLPYTYLDGVLNEPTPLDIVLGVRGKTCGPTTCRTIRVDRAGRITAISDEE